MSYGYYGQRSNLGQALLVRFIPIAIAVAIAGFTMVRGCQEGPFGRRQLLVLSPEQEMKLGADAYREVLQQSQPERNREVVSAVKNVGFRLARASKNPELAKRLGIKIHDFQWEFNVVQSKQINAFCLPGGKVVIYTGILPVCETDSGLATVMGHEIGHALARHGNERMAQTQVTNTIAQGVAVSISDYDPITRQQVLGALGAGANVGILLPFSREHESEADHIGLLLMSIAGYDPHEASRFWIRMKEATGGSRQPEFLSTHPGAEQRAQKLQEWLPEALPLYEASDQQRDALLPR